MSTNPKVTISKETLVGPLQQKFFTKTWTPSNQDEIKASVIFVHGFVEHIERYDHVFEKFAEEGIAVFGFDQRGFGQTASPDKSQGVTTWPLALGDITHFVSHASSLHPSVPLYLLGHSMGGALSLAYATRSPPSEGLSKLKGLIASSPLLRQSPGVKASPLIVRAGSIVGRLSGKLTLKTEVKPADICRDPAVQEAYAKDPLCAPIGTFRGVSDMLLGGEALMTKDYKNFPKDLPVLIVHGTGDKVTDAAASEEFVANLKAAGVKDATYKGFEGFYHEMHNEPGDDKWEEINALTGWIKSKI